MMARFDDLPLQFEFIFYCVMITAFNEAKQQFFNFSVFSSLVHFAFHNLKTELKNFVLNSLKYVLKNLDF